VVSKIVDKIVAYINVPLAIAFSYAACREWRLSVGWQIPVAGRTHQRVDNNDRNAVIPVK